MLPMSTFPSFTPRFSGGFDDLDAALRAKEATKNATREAQLAQANLEAEATFASEFQAQRAEYEAALKTPFFTRNVESQTLQLTGLDILEKLASTPQTPQRQFENTLVKILQNVFEDQQPDYSGPGQAYARYENARDFMFDKELVQDVSVLSNGSILGVTPKGHAALKFFRNA